MSHFIFQKNSFITTEKFGLAKMSIYYVELSEYQHNIFTLSQFMSLVHNPVTYSTPGGS